MAAEAHANELRLRGEESEALQDKYSENRNKRPVLVIFQAFWCPDLVVKNQPLISVFTVGDPPSSIMPHPVGLLGEQVLLREEGLSRLVAWANGVIAVCRLRAVLLKGPRRD